MTPIWIRDTPSEKLRVGKVVVKLRAQPSISMLLGSEFELLLKSLALATALGDCEGNRLRN
jgi:hypothetical protein